MALLGAVVTLALAAPARAETVGTSFPNGFPVIVDHSLGVPVAGFGARGPVRRVPVVFLHGNNDTAFPTTCNSAFGKIHDFAEYFHANGYGLGELWGLSYQGDQCDLQTAPTHKSGPAHSTVENVPDLRAFVHAVLDYTGARQVDIVGHSLGTTLAREWMRQDDAYATVRTLVGVDGPNHGIIDCSPSAQNYFQADGAGGFNPDSAICREYGADDTPLLARLNAGDETPPPTRYVTIVNRDKSFVYFPSQDGVFPGVPAEDREGRPHDFSRSASLAGADATYELTNQGRFDNALMASHTGIVNSPEAWKDAFDELSAPAAPVVAPAGAAPAPAPRLSARVAPARDRRPPYRFRVSGRATGGCGGVVSVQVRRGGLTISTRHVRVHRDCLWSTSVRFARVRGRLTFSARWFGDGTTAGAAAPRRSARAG